MIFVEDVDIINKGGRASSFFEEIQELSGVDEGCLSDLDSYVVDRVLNQWSFTTLFSSQ